mgnify:CR=1 FL=1|tara:strand:+ start:311 stop:601 length:291 start_codon:yes stop_codon:yes gene_type:complete
MENNKSKLKDLVKQIINQLNGEPDEEIDLIPEYYIKGRGDVYCFQPSSKTYVKILRNQKVYVLDEKKDFINRILIYTNCGRIVEIDYDELEYLGFD